MSYSKGLEGVVVDATAISNVEGDIPRLTYRGYAIEELVQCSYEEVAWLVLFGELPTTEQVETLRQFLLGFELTDNEANILLSIDVHKHPMQMLQGMIPLLEIDGAKLSFPGLTAEGVLGLAVVAKLPLLVAGFYRREAVKPDTSLDYLSNFLFMFTGKKPSTEHLEVLKTVQILQLEHSFNAGTFTARVVASALAPVDSVLSSAVGTLFGSLHGGADEAALRDAEAVGSPDAAAQHIADLLASKGKLMGMGHREYKRVDPRSEILKPLAKQLCLGTEFENIYLTLEALETEFNKAMALKNKEVWANLEFYKGAVYRVLGIPHEYFTSVFALARSVGWLAHFNESREDNRIMRPKAEYVGPAFRSIESGQ